MKHISALLNVLKFTFKRARQSKVTLPYPFVKRELPIRTRGRLHNHIEDCTGCKACAEVCPVRCIHITTKDRAPGEPMAISSKESGSQPIPVHVPQFDIDFSTCLWCGLCITVCPTQCLTMTKEYEFSVTDKKDLVWQFGENLEAGPKR